MSTSKAITEFADLVRARAFDSRVEEALSPTFGRWPKEIDHRVMAALRNLGFGVPFLHQKEAVRRALAGENVCLATTTASGKTLCYLVPAANTVSTDADARTLVLLPTKALAWDQLMSTMRFAECLGEQGVILNVGKYDGDTPQSARKKIRNNRVNILFSNPDMLHYAILRYQEKWTDFLFNLRYIVIDELHAYSGYFGTNVALILRRLRQACRRFGSNPQVILASATIDNAEAHARALTGLDVRVIDRSDAGTGRKEVFLVNQGPEQAVTVDLAKRSISMGLQSIVFCNSRADVERIAESIRTDYNSAVEGYRGGYTANDRKRIHEGLKKGEIRCVVATSALELGIDIGALDVCILHGHPGTNAATWQRAGRVGRQEDSETVVAVNLLPHEIDTYYALNPGEFFESRGTPEKAMVTPGNPVLLKSHLVCASVEAKGKNIELDLFPPEAKGLLEDLEVPGSVSKAYTDMNIRFIRPPFIIRDVENDVVIGEIDGNVAHREAHFRAIYRHGRRFRIRRWKKSWPQQIECVPEPRELETWPEVEEKIRLKESYCGFDFTSGTELSMPFLHGIVHLTDKTVGYRERDKETGQWRYCDIRYPRGIELTSEAFAMVMGPALNRRIVSQHGELAPEEILHGLGHLLASSMVRAGGVGTADMVEYVTSYSSELEGPALYICEAVPGGLGFAGDLFDNLETYLGMAYDRISRCPCNETSGCPACIMLKRHCPQWNRSRNKWLLQRFLDDFYKVVGKRTPWTPPVAPQLPGKEEIWKAGDTYPGNYKVLAKENDGVVVRLPSGQPKHLPWKN